MKLAVFSDLVDIRKIRAFKTIIGKHEILWFTNRFFQNEPVDGIRFVCCSYPNRELRKSKVTKAACEFVKLMTPVFPGLMLQRAAEFPVYDHTLLADVDICIPFGDLEVYSVLKARKKYNYSYKVVVRDAETIPFLYRKKLDMRYVWPYINRNADMFMTWSERIRNKELVEGVNPEKIRVLYAGVDTEKFQRKDPEKTLVERYGSKGKSILLSLGKIEENKGLDYALEADRILKRKGLRFVHLYVGTGKRFEFYRRKASRMGISDVSVFVGFVPDEELVDHLNLCDVFVHPSITTKGWQEQFGMAIVEAMSCERPVVATYNGSIPDVVGHTGVLVSERNGAELAGAINCLLKNPCFRVELGKKARQRVMEKFDMYVVAKRFEGFLSELVT